jgi:hypothetical protein
MSCRELHCLSHAMSRPPFATCPSVSRALLCCAMSCATLRASLGPPYAARLSTPWHELCRTHRLSHDPPCYELCHTAPQAPPHPSSTAHPSSLVSFAPPRPSFACTWTEEESRSWECITWEQDTGAAWRCSRPQDWVESGVLGEGQTEDGRRREEVWRREEL